MANEQLNDAEINAQASQLTLWTLQKELILSARFSARACI